MQTECEKKKVRTEHLKAQLSLPQDLSTSLFLLAPLIQKSLSEEHRHNPSEMRQQKLFKL